MILLLVALAVAGFAAYSNIWFWVVHRFVDVEIQVDKTLAEIGDTISLTCVISNRSWFPLPSVKLAVPLPQGLVAVGTVDYHYLSLQTNMGARESITSVATCLAVNRGIQSFQPAEVVLSEGFGMKNIVVQRSIQHELAVLPKVLSQSIAKTPLRSILGNVEVERWIHPDESLYKGTRPYQAGDPFKHIAWLASATSAQWMVKQFSTSSDTTVHLVLSAQFNADHWAGVNREAFDDLCSVLATVAQTLGRRGFELHLWSNAIWHRNGRKFYFGRQSADGIRCLLAELAPVTAAPLPDLLKVLTHTVKHNDDVFIFTPYFNEDHVRVTKSYKDKLVILSSLDDDIVAGPRIKELSL